MENEQIENDIEILRKNRLEEEFERKIDKNQFKILTTFKKIKNLYSDGIMPKLKHHRRIVGNSYKNLMGEENEEDKKIKQKKIIEFKNLQTSRSSKNISYMSDNAKTLSDKIKYHINKVKKSHEDITALNALFLDNNIFVDNQSENNDKSNNRYNSNNLEKSGETTNYEEAIRKKKLRNNFELIANNYHKKMNHAFTKFNPDNYLNNLKMLIQISPTMRDDIEKIKSEVEGDIKDVTDKNRLHKKYKRLLEKNIKSKSVQMLDPRYYKSNKIIKKSVTSKNTTLGSSIRSNKNSILLPSIGNEKPLVNNRDNKIKFGIMRKLKRNDSKRIMNIIDHQVDHMNRLHNISQEISNYIGNENIGHKIDSCFRDFKMHKYFNLFKRNDENKDSSFKIRDYYSSQKDKINGLFGDLYTNKMQAKIIEKERKLATKLRLNKDEYFNKLNNEMKNSLDEFDNNINLNQVNLEENQQNKESTL